MANTSFLLLQVEPFAPVLTIVKLPTKGVEDFLTQAVALANDSLWGTLSANLLVDSRTEQQHKGEGDGVFGSKDGVVIRVDALQASAGYELYMCDGQQHKVLRVHMLAAHALQISTQSTQSSDCGIKTATVGISDHGCSSCPNNTKLLSVGLPGPRQSLPSLLPHFVCRRCC